MASSPYSDLPPRAYWRSGLGAPVPNDFYRPKWPIDKTTPIATAGSCFAQHIGRALRGAGFTILDSEPAPEDLPPERHLDFGYGMYSTRYGNVYTLRQMLQLAAEAFGETEMCDEVWRLPSGAYVDALRPTIEPEGLRNAEAVRAFRSRHLERVRKVLLEMDVFIFTLGLTEAWVRADNGRVYPLCPGTVAGDFDPNAHRFHNFEYPEIVDDFRALRALLDRHRGGRPLRFLLTVSPVPLTATAAGHHVQVSTVYSKSVLRAAAGALSQGDPDVDYFPSYELITSPWAGESRYAANQRSVAPAAVELVMSTFLRAQGVADAETAEDGAAAAAAPPADDALEEDADMLVKCDEELLETFGRGGAA